MADEFEGSENLLDEYLAESPKLTPAELAEAARVFGLPVSEVRNIAKGMQKVRAAVANEAKEIEV